MVIVYWARPRISSHGSGLPSAAKGAGILFFSKGNFQRMFFGFHTVKIRPTVTVDTLEHREDVENYLVRTLPKCSRNINNDISKTPCISSQV